MTEPIVFLIFFASPFQQLGRPLQKNFAAIDAVIRTPNRVHLLQMTISNTHTINLRGLHKAMTSLGVVAPTFAFLYFVVPPDAYAQFANPPYVTHKDHKLLPNNVRIIVLEIPWPEQVGQKRKVRIAAST